MLYNRKDVKKDLDKKILRKVKKNWIVISVSSFVLIGAATVVESNSNTAFASEVPAASSNVISNSNDYKTDTNSAVGSSNNVVQNNYSPQDDISNRISSDVTQTPNTSQSEDYTPKNSQNLKDTVESAKNSGVEFNETSSQQTETVKDKADEDFQDVQKYNDDKINEINQAIEKYKSDLNDYNNKLSDYNNQLDKYADEINKAKQLQSQGIIDGSLLSQQLGLGNEPNANLSITGVGNGLTVNNNSISPIKNAGVSNTEQASRISYDGTGNYKGGQVAIASFTNLSNSYYQDITGVKHNISKIVETFTDLSPQPATGNFFNISISSFLNGPDRSSYMIPSLTIYHNPSHGFVFSASSGVTMKTEYYDDTGNLIPLNNESNAYLVIGSLNNWNNTGGNHREGIFVNNDSDAHPYQLNGSSVTKHVTNNGVAMYSDNINPSTPDGHTWDSAGSQYAYYGSTIVKLTGSNNSVRFTRDATSNDDFPFVWSTVSSSLVGQSAAVPNLFKPIQPSRPVLNVNYKSVKLLKGINKISYVDENNDSLVPQAISSGNNTQSDGLSTSFTILDIEKNGYILLSDNHGDDMKNFIGGVEQDFTVKFGHKVSTVSPENPGQPGLPINPDNPNGPKWPNGTDKDSLTKTVKQTINYVDEKGKILHDASQDEITFTRTAQVDEVTGTVTYGNWNEDSGAFSAKTSPVVPGYVLKDASQKTVGEVEVTPSSSDVDETVSYEKSGSLVPVGTDGNPIDNGSHNVTYPNDGNDAGKVNNPIIPSITGKTPVDKDGNPLTPGTSYPIDDSKPTEDTKITYVNSNQTAKINYVDQDTGKILKSTELSGAPQSTSSYRTTDTIKKYTDEGYEVISNNYPVDGVKFHSDNQEQVFTITLGHKVSTVSPENPGQPGLPINPDNPNGPKWPNGTDKDSLTKTVVRTINYIDQSGKKIHETVVQSITFTRTAQVDEVTGQVIYGEWNQSDGSWNSVDSPIVNGYVLIDNGQKVILGKPVNNNSSNETVNVIYKKANLNHGINHPASSDNKKKLPQTGEVNESIIQVVGIVLLMISLIVRILGLKKKK